MPLDAQIENNTNIYKALSDLISSITSLRNEDGNMISTVRGLKDILDHLHSGSVILLAGLSNVSEPLISTCDLKLLLAALKEEPNLSMLYESGVNSHVRGLVKPSGSNGIQSQSMENVLQTLEVLKPYKVYLGVAEELLEVYQDFITLNRNIDPLQSNTLLILSSEITKSLSKLYACQLPDIFDIEMYDEYFNTIQQAVKQHEELSSWLSEKFGIDNTTGAGSHNTDIFEEVLLGLAGVKTKPTHGCKYKYGDPFETTMFLISGISQNDADRFVKFLVESGRDPHATTEVVKKGVRWRSEFTSIQDAVTPLYKFELDVVCSANYLIPLLKSEVLKLSSIKPDQLSQYYRTRPQVALASVPVAPVVSGTVAAEEEVVTSAPVKKKHIKKPGLFHRKRVHHTAKSTKSETMRPS